MPVIGNNVISISIDRTIYKFVIVCISMYQMPFIINFHPFDEY